MACEELFMMEEEVTASTDLGIVGNDDGNEFVCQSISNKSNTVRDSSVACAPTPCLAAHWRSTRRANSMVVWATSARGGTLFSFAFPTVAGCCCYCWLLLLSLLLNKDFFFSATPSWLWLLMLPREDGRAIANGKDFFIPWVNTT